MAGAVVANARRQRQAETIVRIVKQRTRPNTRFIVLGDMNDPPDSPFLASMTTDAELSLTDALTAPVEDEPAKEEAQGPGPQTTAWSYRFKESGQPQNIFSMATSG